MKRKHSHIFSLKDDVPVEKTKTSSNDHTSIVPNTKPKHVDSVVSGGPKITTEVSQPPQLLMPITVPGREDKPKNIPRGANCKITQTKQQENHKGNYVDEFPVCLIIIKIIL